VSGLSLSNDVSPLGAPQAAIPRTPKAGDDLARLRGLRVAQLIETDGPGGAEQMLADMVSELAAAGCANLVVLPAEREGWLSRRVTAPGVTVEYFRPDRPNCAQWLMTLFRRHRVALVHSHEFSMAIYGAWAAWRAGIPHVTTMHGGRYYAQRLRRRLALRAAFALTDRVVAVSRRLAGQLRRELWMPASRITTVANGVRSVVPPRSGLREELGLGPHDRLVLAVGNLYPVKGHRYAIEALALLRQEQPLVHLAIAGRGETAEALRGQARELGVSGRVHLLGVRGDIPNLLGGADVFILPSLSEGLPLALLEAMSAGCAIVASDVGDVSTALDDGRAGILVPPGDARALAVAVGGLLHTPDRARELAARAQHRAGQEYDVERMVARYAAIYGEVLVQRGRLATA
jgi:glycosyltransferase involved in cell wall biosynthesis